MITGEYIVDCVVYNKDTYKEAGKANVLLSDVSVNSTSEFYSLALKEIEKKFDFHVMMRIVGVFKL